MEKMSGMVVQGFRTALTVERGSPPSVNYNDVCLTN